MKEKCMYGTGDPGGPAGPGTGLIMAGGAVAAVGYSTAVSAVLAGLCAAAGLFLYRSRRLRPRAY
jgi:hypothetical protein